MSPSKIAGWKRLTMAAALLAGLWIGHGAALADEGAAREDREPRLVKTVAVTPADARETRTFPGVVQAEYETDLSFRVGGPLVDLAAQIGQKVSPDQVLARIDPRDFNMAVKKLQAAVAQAQANLSAMKKGAREEDIARMEAQVQAAKTGLAEAESNFERYKSLYDQKAVARAAFDSAKTARQAAQAQLTAAEKALEMGKSGARKEDIEAMEAQVRLLKVDLQSARNALADTELKAPFQGLVNRRYVENFQTVAPGQPIVSLLNLASIEVSTSVPQTLMARIGDWKGIQCAFDAHPGLTLPGEIREIGQKTEGPGMSYPLTVTIRVPETVTLLPGMAADVTITLKNHKNGQSILYLPGAAVFADAEGQPCVWKIDPETATLSKVRVRTGEPTGNGIQVLEGLSEGDRVVGAGARFLREGQAVRFEDGGAEGGR